MTPISPKYAPFLGTVGVNLFCVHPLTKGKNDPIIVEYNAFLAMVGTKYFYKILHM